MSGFVLGEFPRHRHSNRWRRSCSRPLSATADADRPLQTATAVIGRLERRSDRTSLIGSRRAATHEAMLQGRQSIWPDDARPEAGEDITTSNDDDVLWVPNEQGASSSPKRRQCAASTVDVNPKRRLCGQRRLQTNPSRKRRKDLARRSRQCRPPTSSGQDLQRHNRPSRSCIAPNNQSLRASAKNAK